MPSGFFALHRFYLRVDDVLIRINDTRLYYEKDKDYVLREYTSRESRTKDLKVRLASHIQCQSGWLTVHYLNVGSPGVLGRPQ